MACLFVSFAGQAYALQCADMTQPAPTASALPCHDDGTAHPPAPVSTLPDCCENGTCLLCFIAPLTSPPEPFAISHSAYRVITDAPPIMAYANPYYRLLRPPRIFLS